MTIRCASCSQLTLPDADGRTKPWCSACGAALANAGESREAQPAPAFPNPDPTDWHLRGAGVATCGLTRRPTRKPASAEVTLLIGLVILGLGVTVVANNLDNFVKGWSSQNWTKTQGVVVRSWVDEFISNRGSRSFTLGAIYRYQVDGRIYESSKVQFSNQLQSGDKARGEQELAKIAPARQYCVVYYDPKDPAQSCLIPGLSYFYLVFLPLLALFFLLIGGIGTWKSGREVLGFK